MSIDWFFLQRVCGAGLYRDIDSDLSSKQQSSPYIMQCYKIISSSSIMSFVFLSNCKWHSYFYCLRMFWVGDLIISGIELSSDRLFVRCLIRRYVHCEGCNLWFWWAVLGYTESCTVCLTHSYGQQPPERPLTDLLQCNQYFILNMSVV